MSTVVNNILLLFLKKQYVDAHCAGLSRDSPTKVKSRNFLTNNISYNRLKHMGFYNALFIINCFTYILSNLNLFFLEQTFDNEYDRERVIMIWTYLVRNKFYIFICKHDNFNVLNNL